MKILKYKKIGPNKYKVFFENSELILYEDVILKYNLISRNNIELSQIDDIIEDNKYYELYNVALKYLSIRLRTKKELKKYLTKKDVDANLIAKVIKELEKNGYLNEKIYIQAFINDSLSFKKDGPYKIKSDLIKLGCEEFLINEYLSKVDPITWEEKITKFIDKSVSNNNKYSINMLRQKILSDLYIKGYDKEMVYPFIENIKTDEESNLKNEYNKAYKKYSIKYKDKDLKNKIISYLQTKGYEYYRILEIIDKS